MSRDAEIDPVATARFLETAFEADEWLAVFLKWHRSGRVAQRVAPASVIIRARFQDWLVRENQSGASVYVSVNVLRARTALRRRNAIGVIRHVFLDVDHDLNAVLAAIVARGDLPEPSYVIHTSEGRGHVFWRVRGFDVNYMEALEKHLARELHTDPAATACSQLTRSPGYLNQKRLPASRVTVRYGAAAHITYTRADFPHPVMRSDERDEVVTRERRLAFGADTLHRARRYLAAVPPAISGQHGDMQTFRVCCRLARGFALSDAEALVLLAEWNAGCRPPWSERELMDKLRGARRYGREPIGGLLGDGV